MSVGKPEKASNRDVQSSNREQSPANGGAKSLILAALLVGAIAAPAGWFLGQQLATEPNQIASTPEDHTGSTRNKDEVTMENPVMNHARIIPLKPILTNLHAPDDDVWIRMEVALIMKQQQGMTPEQMAEISNDFIALMRQIPLIQLKGATGLMNLREDLLDRARVRSEDKVAALLISNLVIE